MAERLQRITMVEEVIRNMLLLIETAKLQPGDRFFSERELVQRWGVSRTTIREAIKALVFSDVLTTRQGSGTYLNKLPDYLLDSYRTKESSIREASHDFEMRMEARFIFEEAVAKLAAQRITSDELEHLEQILQTMNTLIQSENFRGYALEDLNFHYHIVRAARNKYLMQAMLFYWHGSVAEWYVGFGIIPRLEETSFEQHQQIYLALKNHDEDLAVSLMHHHLEYCETEHVRYVRNTPPPSPEEVELLDETIQRFEKDTD